MVFIIDHIHHLIKDSKIQSFIYNSDQTTYNLSKNTYKLVTCSKHLQIGNMFKSLPNIKVNFLSFECASYILLLILLFCLDL